LVLEIRSGSQDPLRIMAHSELGRLSSIQRTAKLIGALLSGRELTRADLTGLLGVRVAAADRQLEAIGRHIPLVREKRRGRLHVRIDRSKVAGGAERIPIATTIAACVGASLGRLFEGTNYEKGMHDLVQYVSRDAVHPERFQDSRRQFVFLVRGGEKALPEKEELLEEVVDALQRRRGLQIRYRSFDGARRSVRIEPLSLALYDHQLYVIARPRGREAHPYRFSRIEAAEAVGGTFQYPDKDSYDPERVFANSFGIFVEDKYAVERIEVSLAPRWAAFVRSHRWHRSQESFTQAGRIHVRLRVRLCPEVVSWVLGFGPEARVVGPPSLRRRIAHLARQMAKAHRFEPSKS
jgi:predicted DNA-binding transcriptional regulator YafY